MSGNIFGQRFQIISFGESHGHGLGVVIDGCPSEIMFDEALLTKDMTRRRPGQKINNISIVYDRHEPDSPEVLSGVFLGKTLGTPIAILVRNQDARSKDYQEIAKAPRPGHADDTWKMKFGHTDPRGGGRSSGRETLARVMGGAVAKMFIQQTFPEIKIFSFSHQIGPYSLSPQQIKTIQESINSSDEIDAYSSRCPDNNMNSKIEELLLNAKKDGKSYGGQACLIIKNPPQGLGQPVFHKLKSDLASAFMSLGATTGVELGAGHLVTDAEGSDFHQQADQSQYGGIRGGISTGESIIFNILFKPTATVLDTAKKGRHDPCIIPRAIPVLEAMAALVIADHLLWQRQDRV
ncbi:MAG: chorismate synthase [Bdellovibrionales bacterium]|nr:chorismate synthase [Bdellovibrionales bacterium]